MGFLIYLFCAEYVDAHHGQPTESAANILEVAIPIVNAANLYSADSNYKKCKWEASDNYLKKYTISKYGAYQENQCAKIVIEEYPKGEPDYNSYNVYEFIKKVIFVYDGAATQDSLLKHIASLRQVIFAISENPIGKALLNRISRKLELNETIFIYIKGKNFLLNGSLTNYHIVVPEISFDNNICSRIDESVISLCRNSEGWCLGKVKRPYYLGLVHELIHVLHKLEQEPGIKYSVPQAVGGDTMWGNVDDCFVITGTRDGPGKTYEPISEFSFRVAAGLPVRISYPAGSSYEQYLAEEKCIMDDTNSDMINTIIGYILSMQNKETNLLECVGPLKDTENKLPNSIKGYVTYWQIHG